MVIVPKRNLAKWSVGLLVAMPTLFFIGASLANRLYAFGPAGSTILEDVKLRPLLPLTMVVAMTCGISAFISGIIAILKQKERAILVYLSTVMGALLFAFLVAELVFPH